MALASGVRGRMPAEMNAAKDAKIARNDPSHTNTDRRHADDATLTNTWQQQNAQNSAGKECGPPGFFQCPLNTRFWNGRISAWSRRINACTSASASTTWRAKARKTPVSLATIVSWLSE
jgi:hypothetical protein